MSIFEHLEGGEGEDLGYSSETDGPLQGCVWSFAFLLG